MPALVIGACLLGFAPLFVKAVGLGPTPIGMYRCGLGAVFLYIGFLLQTRKAFHLKLKGDFLFYSTLAGLLFALDLYVWHRSVIYAGAGIGTILGNTQVFYVSLAGVLFFQEKVTPRFLISISLGFLGTYLLVFFRPASVDFGNPDYFRGIQFGLATGLVYSGYVLTIRKIEKLDTGIPASFRLAVISFVTALALFVVASGEGTLRLPTPLEWLWLVLLALIAQVIAWLLISKAIMKVSPSHIGLILLLQPLVATLSGAVVYGEALSFLQVLGAALTLVGIYLGSPKKLKPAVSTSLRA